MEQSPFVALSSFQHDVYLKTTPENNRKGDHGCVHAIFMHVQASFNRLPDPKSPCICKPKNHYHT